MTYSFNSRSSYIIARMDWRDNYRELSANIRAARQTFIEAQRAYSASPETKTSSAVANARWALSKLRSEATKQLELRQKMKEEAALQWAEQRVSPETQVV